MAGDPSIVQSMSGGADIIRMGLWGRCSNMEHKNADACFEIKIIYM